MSIEDLKAKLAEAPRDDHELGTVISWVMGGQYIYAAIKTQSGWYATSYNDNGWIPRRMNYEQLRDVLTQSEASQIRIALTWEYLLDYEAAKHEVEKPKDTLYVLMDDDNVSYLGWYTSVKKAKKDAAERFDTAKSEWARSNVDDVWYANDNDGTTMAIVPVPKGE